MAIRELSATGKSRVMNPEESERTQVSLSPMQRVQAEGGATLSAVVIWNTELAKQEIGGWDKKRNSAMIGT